MEKRRFGRTGMMVSFLGFGGAEIGFEQAEASTVEKLLLSALDQGLNVIDTAECYVDSEELIGRAVGKQRDRFYLFSKCGHPSSWDAPDWRASSIARTIDRSLKRLRTDYIDLMQLHSCELEHLSQGEVIEALESARDAGKVRFIGYSGDGEAARYAVKTGRFDALQTSVSIFDQEAIDRQIPMACERDMGVIAKRPLANAVWRFAHKPENEYYHAYWQRMGKLSFEFLGDKDLAAEIALRFTFSVPGVHTAIVGTKKPGRWQENRSAIEKGKLSPSEYEAIRRRWREVCTPRWVGQV